MYTHTFSLHDSVAIGRGRRFPIGNTASGRAYAAARSAADREQVLAGVEQQDLEQWQRLVAARPGTLDLYARSGFVLTLGDHIDHVNGIAAPLWSPAHATCFVFAIGGLATVMTEERLHDDIGPRLPTMLGKVRDLLEIGRAHV